MSWDPKRLGHYCNKCDGQVTVDAPGDRYWYGTFGAHGRQPPPGTAEGLKSGLMFCELCTGLAYEALQAFCADLPIVLAERAELAARAAHAKDETRGRVLLGEVIDLLALPEVERPMGFAGSPMFVLDTLKKAKRLLG